MLHWLFQRLIWYLIKGLFLTLKVDFQNREVFERARTLHPQRIFIFAVWHEHVVSVLRAHAWSEPLLTLSSRSKDGDYADFVARKLGFIGVRGSSKKGKKDKGGKEALLQYISMFKQGHSGGMTVDGPRGPRHVCKPGAIFVAKETGCAVVPVTAKTSSYWEFNSWDRFKVPRPFARITIVYGEPFLVPADADEAAIQGYCQRVHDTIEAL